MSIEKVIALADEAAVYIPAESESIRIDYTDQDNGCFYGTGEESGEQYRVEYSEVDLDNDMFYKLVLMENK